MTTSFGSIYRQHAASVYRFALLLSGSPTEADDVTAETFARAWTAAGQIRTATVRAYLFTIARNVYLHRRRKSGRETEIPESLEDGRATPEQAAEGREALGAVVFALERLPESDRAAILMRGQDGMSVDDISAALGLSVVATKVKIHRARLKLAALLRDHGEKHENHA